MLEVVFKAYFVHQVGKHDQWVVYLFGCLGSQVEVLSQTLRALFRYCQLHSESPVPKSAVMGAGVSNSVDMVQE